MPSDFDRAILIIIGHEVLPGSTDGSFTITPGDQGGATKWGVTAKTLGAWRKLGRDATADEVKALGQEEAFAIYRALYWDFFRCGELEDQVLATKVFDMEVNMAPEAVGRILQQACNRCQSETLVVDGVIGSKTIAAANRCDAGELVTELIHLSEQHYRDIVEKKPSQQKFLKDWLSRAQWPFQSTHAAA